MISGLLKISYIHKAKQCLPAFVKNYYHSRIRVAGIKRLQSGIKEQLSLKIVVGASSIFQEGWIPTEESFLNILNNSDWERFFKPGSIDKLLAEHVWEHLTEEQGLLAARNCFKYLKAGATMRIAVPDGFNPDKDYLQLITPPSLGHKMLYNYKNLSGIFEKAGFMVKPLEYYDKNHEFHYNHWSTDDGFVSRSLRFDQRNKTNKIVISSVIIDAIKENANGKI